MSLMGTLAKVAIGYAAARGVDKLSGGQGLGNLLGGGAQVPGSGAANPLQNMMKQMTGGQGNPMGAMLDQLKAKGIDLSALTGGAQGDGAKGGLLAGLGGTGAMAGAAGGLAALQGKGLAGLFDAMNPSEAAPEAEAAAGLMLRAMIQSAKADGGIDATEKAKILETLGDDADEQDIAFVREQLAADIDIDALAADTPPMQRAQVYSASLMTIRVDTPAEAQYLDQLAKALGLDETTVNGIHLASGMQPLYS